MLLEASHMQHNICNLCKATEHDMIIVHAMPCHLPLQDKQFPFSEWAAVKPTTPFGQVPVLQVGDTVVAQSAAIGKSTSRIHMEHPQELCRMLMQLH
jgi:hypothetical protein